MNEQYLFYIQINGNADQRLQSVGRSASVANTQIRGLKASVSAASVALGGLAERAISFAANMAGSVSGDVIRTTAEMEALRNAITFASGADAAKNLSFVDKEVQRLGLDGRAALEGFKTLQGAVMGTALAGEPARKTFQAVAQAATVMGLGAEDQKGVFLALGQMISKGKVQAEELRGQLGERLPGAFQIAARAMGVTTKELDKMMEQGQVTSDKFLPAFAKELEKTFAGGVNKASQSLQAGLNRWGTEILTAKSRIGGALTIPLGALLSGSASEIRAFSSNVAMAFRSQEAQVFIGHMGEMWRGARRLAGALATELMPVAGMFFGLLGQAASVLGTVAGWLGRNIQVVKALGVSIGALYLANKAYVAVETAKYLWTMRNVIAQGLQAGPMAFLTGMTWTQVAATAKLTLAQWGLNTAMLANPVGLVVVAVAALAGVIYYAWQESETFRGVITGLWTAVGALINKMLALAKVYFGIITLNKEMALAGRDAFLNGESIGEAFGRGYDKGVGKFVAPETPMVLAPTDQAAAMPAGFAQGLYKPKPIGGSEAAGQLPGASPTGGTTGAGGSTTQGGLDRVSGGGSKPTNITINLGALNQGGITINSQTVNQGADSIRDVLVEQLLRVLNGANQLS